MKINKCFKKKSGVYCIVNKKNNKKYIGSSKNIWQRLQCHRSYLRNNSHTNKHLQSSYNKHGESQFDVYVIEYCDNYLEREQFYLDSVNPEYNQMKTAVGSSWTDSMRLNASISRLNGFKNGTITTYQDKKVYRYDLNGNFIDEFPTIKEMCEKTQCSQSQFYRYINGKSNRCRNWLFSFEKKEKIDSYKKYDFKNRKMKTTKIYLVDIKTNEYLDFNSVKECANFFNTITPNILQYEKRNLLFKSRFMVIK